MNKMNRHANSSLSSLSLYKKIHFAVAGIAITAALVDFRIGVAIYSLFLGLIVVAVLGLIFFLAAVQLISMLLRERQQEGI